jgi:hypothetical protein
MARWLPFCVLALYACLAVGCKRHPYDVAKVRQEGSAIVAAIKQYENDNGVKLRKDLSILSPKYLRIQPAYGIRPGQWSLGSGYANRETDTIYLNFRLREDGGVTECYMYDDSTGQWTLKRFSKDSF